MKEAATISEQDVEALIAWMQTHLPSFAVCYKDESRLQRLIAWLLKPINPRYMTLYTTVMFGKVYFPSREIVAEYGWDQVYGTLRHEFVHLMDARRFPVWFEFSYLFLFPAGWTMRAFWELRGYTQNMIVEFEQTGQISPVTCERIADQFVSAAYGWMVPFRASIERDLARLREEILAGRLSGPYPYGRMSYDDMPELISKSTHTRNNI
jgi:hypothetical protein